MKPRVNLLATATSYNHFSSNQRYETRVFSISNSVFCYFHASQFHAFWSPYTLLHIHSIHTHIYTQAFPHTWLWLVGWNIMALLFVFMCGAIMFCCWTITPKLSHNTGRDEMQLGQGLRITAWLGGVFCWRKPLRLNTPIPYVPMSPNQV